MKAIIQRVLKASVIVNNETISSIGRGICVLIGIGRDDNDDDIEYMIKKLLNLRLFTNSENNKSWDKSVKDLNLELLCVSQFTLYATFKGNKLDLHHAMNPDDASLFYKKFLEKLTASYLPDKIKDGRFGVYRSVCIENDGPVTITIDSKNRK